MSELMRAVRDAATTEAAVRLLQSAGYSAWEARMTALAERGEGGPYDVIVDDEYVVPGGKNIPALPEE